MFLLRECTTFVFAVDVQEAIVDSVALALVTCLVSFGKAIKTKIPMITSTTSISVNVNALSFLFILVIFKHARFYIDD